MREGSAVERHLALQGRDRDVEIEHAVRANRDVALHQPSHTGHDRRLASLAQLGVGREEDIIGPRREPHRILPGARGAERELRRQADGDQSLVAEDQPPTVAARVGERSARERHLPFTSTDLMSRSSAPSALKARPGQPWNGLPPLPPSPPLPALPVLPASPLPEPLSLLEHARSVAAARTTPPRPIRTALIGRSSKSCRRRSSRRTHRAA